MRRPMQQLQLHVVVLEVLEKLEAPFEVAVKEKLEVAVKEKLEKHKDVLNIININDAAFDDNLLNFEDVE